MHLVTTLRHSVLAALAVSLAAVMLPSRASAEATLLIEADTGRVLQAENATYPWYPASVTKLMTAYVTLQAVKSGRLSLDSLLTVSTRAAAQQPSKMGFKPGTTVTVDNALKMLMVKSANDIAVVLAEGVSGSIEKFADDMNAASRRLGMTQSSWVNPNGLPAENQISSARDLAILARALIREFPEYDFYWHIPAIKFGKKVMRNYNTLIGRYEGADGMKTGFICAAGFNLVASATRHGKRLIVVVLGAPSSPVRAVKAASLLERGFNRGALAWLGPNLGTVDSLPPMASAPPDLREEMCGKHRRRPAAEEADEEPDANGNFTLANLLPHGNAKPSQLLGDLAPATPIVVFTGPPKRPTQTMLASTGAKLVDQRKVGRAAPAAAAIPAIVTDPHTAPLTTSFAPTGRPAPEPLTAVPAAAASPRFASVPMPRPRPKIAKPRKH